MEDDLLGFFITWTCYGTWLPGDARSWTKWRKGDQLPQPQLAVWCRQQMKETYLILSNNQQEIVNESVSDHCKKREWTLHAVNCRSNHCHVVLTASDYKGKIVRDQLKGWAKRRLKEHDKQRFPGGAIREHWWTDNGSVRSLFDEESLEAAIVYTMEAQDLGGSHRGTHF